MHMGKAENVFANGLQIKSLATLGALKERQEGGQMKFAKRVILL